MNEENQMGSQTLEILRQGVWASLTGGWFYDPHQDVFCNTFHLYVWLYLLCVPFCIYVYFPPSWTIWYFYCGSVTLGLTVLKLINYGLHHMYDTKECIQEEVEETPQGLKKEDEGIELQILSSKSLGQTSRAGTKLTHRHDIEFGPLHSTDVESLESDFHQMDCAEGTAKPSSTIDLKAEVHRKNSSASSEDLATVPKKILPNCSGHPEKRKVRTSSDRRRRHRSRTTNYVNFMKEGKKLKKKSPNDQGRGSQLRQRTSLQNVESDHGSSNFRQIESSGRRHSNFTSLSFLPSTIQVDIKPTGSLELAYIDKNLNQPLTSESYYFKPTVTGVRRIRSTVLEACSPPLSLDVHPNSFEIIGGTNLMRNPLPPPSTCLIRNQHLNLCPYYGSEIVYPIAEQSDEQQTSQGPDTDVESLEGRSDSDCEENDQGSHSPLMYIKSKKPKSVPYSLNDDSKYQQTSINLPSSSKSVVNNSKDRLIENNDNSNSSTTPDMQDARTDFYNTDNDASDKNLSLSNSSLELDDNRAGCMYPSPEEKIEKPISRKPKEIDRIIKLGEEQLPVVVPRKKKITRTRRRALSDAQKGILKCRHQAFFNTEPLKTDTEWSSTTTVSLEHDVSKVLQDPVPSTSSLGAIPKKSRSNSRDSAIPRKVPNSESEKCKICRCKPSLRLERERNRPTKENKVTQTQMVHSESTSPVENFAPIIHSPPLSEGAEDEVEVDISNADAEDDVSKIDTQLKNEDGSSNSSNNELSTLLPPPSIMSLLLQYKPPTFTVTTSLESSDCGSNRLRLKRMNRAHRRRSSNIENIPGSISSGYGTYTCRNFRETIDACTVSAMDEYGDFARLPYDNKEAEACANTEPDGPSTSQAGLAIEKSSLHRRRSETAALPNTPITPVKPCRPINDVWDSNSTESICNSSISTVLDVSVQKSNQPLSSPATSEQQNRLKQPYEHDRLLIETESKFKCIESEPVDNRYKRTKTYYVFKVWPWTNVKVSMDRLKLLALLDRNLTLQETIVSIILGSLVCILGAILLYKEFYRDISSFILCFVIASCQYSLIKSVQPDAASPTHGFNRVIAYSRPLYFCMFSSLVLIFDSYISKETRRSGYDLNSLQLSTQQCLLFVCDFFVTFILVFPVLFSLGLFPQINTFLLYMFEQLDMHLFGGNAMSSLSASCYCIFRSIVTVIILWGVAYGGLTESKGAQHVLFSMYCAALVATCYHLSRTTSDPTHIWKMLKNHLWLPDVYREQQENSNDEEAKKRDENNEMRVNDGKDDCCKEEPKNAENKEKTVKFPSNKEKYNMEEDIGDPLPSKLQKINNARLKHDVIVCCLIALLVFAVHASTVFTVLQPELSPVLWSICATLGFILHYILPQMRKHLPWLCIARPILRSHEHEQYQIKEPAKVMWYEKVYVYFSFLERNILLPLLFLSVLTEDSPRIVAKYGTVGGSFIVVICGIKCLRNSYSNQTSQYLILVFTALFYKYDVRNIDETFLVIYFFMITVYNKIYELLLKIQFIVTYIAPWQITWGSAFHAFAQPFSVPHSAMLFLQVVLSSCLSMPLNPFLGSAIFIVSYVRPIKFWERDYNTRRVDHSNTPLSSHLERNLGADDNNLNSLFYEHLTRSLQTSLCGDLKMGRWGTVNQGDCFVLASDYLNCMVHIIEIGNDVITFQMRGLEFRGTYCQQREVEAITEGVEENDGCCCCDTGHLPNMLSVNAAFNQRWLAWQVMAAKYILEGYSISDNSAVSMLQVFEFRKVLVSYYVKSIIFYLLRSPKLEDWLFNPTISKALISMEQKTFVDLDPVFNYNIDEDYDMQNSGITRNSFMQIHGEWITYCVERSGKHIDSSFYSPLMVLCFALSLLGRRTLGAVSHNTVSSVEFFLYGLHALFKGDFRISCARDEWVFCDMDLLKTVVAPGVRMSLKLHQDHFMSADEYEDLSALYDAICRHEEELVISHEGDPAWRRGVLSGAPSLLALRHVLEEGNDEYKIIMLNKRFLSFRVIKVNKECVRGLWAGQQQELVYFRNRNPERGSIQNAKQALRNIINSSCDQPIGYPIYVSPLTTSYAETNEHYSSLIGGSVSLKKVKNYFLNTFRRIRKRCGEGCSSGSANREEIGMGHEGMYAMTPVSTLANTGSQSTDGSHLGGSIGRGSSLSRTSLGGNRGSLVSMGKPTSSALVSLTGLFKERDERAVSQVPDVQIRGDDKTSDTNAVAERECLTRVRIIDLSAIHDSINHIRKFDILWPNEYIRIRSGRTYWKDWVPEIGMEGTVVHKWIPNHKDPNKRSHTEKTILLINIEDKYVPITENGIQDLGAEV